RREYQRHSEPPYSVGTRDVAVRSAGDAAHGRERPRPGLVDRTPRTSPGRGAGRPRTPVARAVLDRDVDRDVRPRCPTATLRVAARGPVTGPSPVAPERPAGAPALLGPGTGPLGPPPHARPA